MEEVHMIFKNLNILNLFLLISRWGFPHSSLGKESACSTGDPGSTPGLGRFPGEGNGYPLQYSCLENPMDGGAWWAAVHGVTESGTTERLTLHFSGGKWSENMQWHRKEQRREDEEEASLQRLWSHSQLFLGQVPFQSRWVGWVQGVFQSSYFNMNIHFCH